MFKIRKEQMEAVSQVALKNFEDRMFLHLPQDFPEETKAIPAADLRTAIRVSIDKADKYGVTDEVDVQRYLEYAVRYGTDFDTNAKTFWAGEILRAKELTGTEKMNHLDEYELFMLTLRHP